MKIKIEKQKLEDNLYLAISHGEIKKGDVIRPLEWIPWVFDKKVEEVEFFIKDSDWSNGVCCWIKTDKALTLGWEYSITTQKTKNKEITYNTGKEETVVQPTVEQTVDQIVDPLQEIYDCIKENKGSDLSEKIKQLINDEDKGISWCRKNNVIGKIEKRIEKSQNHNLYENLYTTLVKIYLENEYYDEARKLYCEKIKKEETWDVPSKLSKDIIEGFLRKNEIKDILKNELFKEYKTRLEIEDGEIKKEKLDKICRIMAFCYLADNQIGDGINKIKEINPNSEAIKYLTKIKQKETDAETFAYFAGCFRKFEDWQNYSELFINGLPENLLKSISPDNDEEKLLEKTIKSSKSYPNSKLYERYGKLVEKYDNIFEFKQIRGRLRETEKRKLSSLEDILAKIKDNTEFEYCDFSLSNISSKESIQENELIQEKVDEAIELFTEENCKNANKLHWLVHFLLQSLNYIKDNYENIKKKFEEIASKSSHDLYFVLYCLANERNESDDAMKFLEEAKKDKNSDACKLAELYGPYQTGKEHAYAYESMHVGRLRKEYCKPDEYSSLSADVVYMVALKTRDDVEKLKWLFSAAKQGHKKAVKEYSELSIKHPKNMTDEMKSYQGGLERKHWLDEARDIILDIQKTRLLPTSEAIMDLDENTLIDLYSNTQENKDLHRRIAARLGEIYYMKYKIASIKQKKHFPFKLYCCSAESKALFRSVSGKEGKESSLLMEAENNGIVLPDSIKSEYKKEYEKDACRYLYRALSDNHNDVQKASGYPPIGDIDKEYWWTAFYMADILISENSEYDNFIKDILGKSLTLFQCKMLYSKQYGGDGYNSIEQMQLPEDIKKDPVQAILDFWIFDKYNRKSNAGDYSSRNNTLKLPQKALNAVKNNVYAAIIQALDEEELFYKNIEKETKEYKEIGQEIEKIKIKNDIEG